MINIKSRIFEVLDKSYLMSLATQDDNGPWVADLIFIHDEKPNIYWMSDSEARHSKAILKKNNVAGSITLSTKSKDKNLGIQFEGFAEQLKGVQFELLVKHLAKSGYPIPKLSQAKKILDGDCWYKLTPSRIFLIDEENFEYERRGLDF